MAEEKEDTESGEQKAPKGSSSKKMIIIGGGVASLVIIGVVAAVLLSGGKKEENEHTVHDLAEGVIVEETPTVVAEGHDDEDEFDEGEEPLGAILPLDVFVVNLKGGRFLRAQLQVEFAGRDIPKRYFARQVPIRDAMLRALSTRTAEDLLDEGGQDQLKRDVRDIINMALRREEVRNVYITQFVVQ